MMHTLSVVYHKQACTGYAPAGAWTINAFYDGINKINDIYNVFRCILSMMGGIRK